MEKRVRIFSNCWPYDLEKDINIFLESTAGKVHQIEFKVTQLITQPNFHAYITYTPENKNEQRRQEEENKKSDERIQRTQASFWKSGRPTC
jgi:hypothetical protein